MNVVHIIDLFTVIIVLYGFGYAVIMVVQMHVEHRRWDGHSAVDMTVIRVKLGTYLLLALEMFIAADIILTIWEPSLEHLAELWAIVVIRIVITHFLQKEMNELSEEWVEH